MKIRRNVPIEALVEVKRTAVMPEITYDADGTPLIDGECPSWAIDEIIPTANPFKPNVTLRPTNDAARFICDNPTLFVKAESESIL